MVADVTDDPRQVGPGEGGWAAEERGADSSGVAGADDPRQLAEKVRRAIHDGARSESVVAGAESALDALLDRNENLAKHADVRIGQIARLRRRVEAAERAGKDACDVAIWMSGSPSFGPEGEAHEGWIGGMRDKLYAAIEVLL